MYAYAPDGTPIASTKEAVPGACRVVKGSFSAGPEGPRFEYSGGTEHYDNGQMTVRVNGQDIFVDDDEGEWPACALVLVPNEIDPEADDEADRELPADAVAAAYAALEAWEASKPFRAAVPMPKGGWPDASSLDRRDLILLSPIAATLALLAGHTSCELAADPGLAAAMMPQAIALARLRGPELEILDGAAALHPRNGAALPSSLGGIEVVDLADGLGKEILEISEIEWDDDGSDADLPKDVVASVPADWAEDNGLVDLLSDRYSFCIKSLGAVVRLGSDGSRVHL